MKDYSGYTTFSFEKGQHAGLNVEDPLTGKREIYPLEKLQHSLKEFIKEQRLPQQWHQENFLGDSENSENWEKWFHRKWRKALHYYFWSARKGVEEGELLSTPFVKENDHLTPSSDMLERRTKRFFRGTRLSTKQLHLLEKMVASVYTSSRAYFSKLANLTFFMTLFLSEDNPTGLYVYDVEGGGFKLEKEGDFSSFVCECMGGLESAKTAGFSLFWTLDLTQLLEKIPSELGLRILYCEAGRIGQYFLNQLSSWGWSGVPTPALSDSKLTQFLLDSEEKRPLVFPIYSLTMGQ